MPPNCLLAYISMKLRENLSTPPFLDQPPLSAFYPLSTEIFETPPFSQFWESPTPPFRKGGVRAMIMVHSYGKGIKNSLIRTNPQTRRCEKLQKLTKMCLMVY